MLYLAVVGGVIRLDQIIKNKEQHINIFELIIFVLFIICGSYSGKLLAVYFGLAGRIIGFVVGFSLAVLVYYLIMHFWNKWFPIDPPCKNGKCLSNDYELVERNQDGTVYRCKCGTKYFKKLPRFKEMLDDGSTKPYMRRKGIFGRWEKDT